jgi:hypothetical protein
MGPWIFSKHQGLLVERPSAKIHFEKCPPNKNISREIGKTSIFEKTDNLFLPFYFFFGPHGARDQRSDLANKPLQAGQVDTNSICLLIKPSIT